MQRRVDVMCDAALAVMALVGFVALFFTGRIPEQQPTGDEAPAEVEAGAAP